MGGSPAHLGRPDPLSPQGMGQNRHPRRGSGQRLPRGHPAARRPPARSLPRAAAAGPGPGPGPAARLPAPGLPGKGGGTGTPREAFIFLPLPSPPPAGAAPLAPSRSPSPFALPRLPTPEAKKGSEQRGCVPRSRERGRAAGGRCGEGETG